MKRFGLLVMAVLALSFNGCSDDPATAKGAYNALVASLLGKMDEINMITGGDVDLPPELAAQFAARGYLGELGNGGVTPASRGLTSTDWEVGMFLIDVFTTEDEIFGLLGIGFRRGEEPTDPVEAFFFFTNGFMDNPMSTEFAVYVDDLFAEDLAGHVFVGSGSVGDFFEGDSYDATSDPCGFIDEPQNINASPAVGVFTRTMQVNIDLEFYPVPKIVVAYDLELPSSGMYSEEITVPGLYYYDECPLPE